MNKQKGVDIVADIFAQIEYALRDHLNNDLGFEQSLVDRIVNRAKAKEPDVRRQWQGSRIEYIAAKPRPDDEVKRQALEEVKRTGKVSESATKHGLSRATMYRLLHSETDKR